ncbi:beta strand repeat-containing protein, partial [Flavobacterium sp.]|uniref:beta strand repeat-containing protein n=1 Tax=Flavobacterium sp. TaxID=239 RepID=UPI003B9DB259
MNQFLRIVQNRRKFWMLFYLVSVVAVYSQPSVLFTSLNNTTPAPNNLRFSLSALSPTFNQVRFQSNQSVNASTATWAFHIGTPGTPNYNSNWRPYTGGNTLSVNTYIPVGFANGARFNSNGGGSDGLLPAITSGNYYTFNVTNNAGDNIMQLLETNFNPKTFSNVAFTTPANTNSSARVTLTSSAPLSVGENVFVRYSFDNYVTSTLAEVTFIGTSGTAYIPCRGSAGNVSFYVYSSNKTLVQINADVATNGQTAHDMATLNLNNNGGANYSYTQGTGSATNFAGDYVIPSSCYPTLASFITALNAGTITGAVNCYINAGYTETAPAGGFTITATGTTTNTITFIKNGSGANPTFTAPAHTAGSLTDAVIKIIGGDFITIDGLTLQERNFTPVSADTASGTNTMTEFGVALLYASATNGAQNNLVRNCTISLNRTYTNSFGIYSNTRHTATAVATTADITATTGSNSNNRFYSNTISNVNMGIALIGSGNASFMDTGNDIGGTSSATGNTITNWGGASAAGGFNSNTVTNYCIFLNHQVGENVSFNTITSATVSGTAVTFRGIFKNYSVIAPTGTFTSNINNNTITLNSGFTSGTFEHINSQGMTALATATININNNTILNSAVSGTASSSNIIGIANSSAPGTLSISSNVFRGITSTATTGGFTAISNSGAVVNTINITNNQIGNASGNAVTFSAATSGTVNGISNSGGATTAALVITGNDFRGIVHSTAGTSAHNYIINSAATLSQNISSNTFTNLTVNTTGSVTMISNNVALTSTGSKTINNNSIVTGFNKTGAGGTLTLHFDNANSVAGSTVSNNGNNFSNITVSGSTIIDGFRNTDGGSPTKNVQNNTFTNWTAGSGAVVALTVSFNAAAQTVCSGNLVSNITSSGNITGITTAAGNIDLSGNTVHSLTSSGASTVSGISVTGGSSGVVQNFSRNKVFNLENSNASGFVNGMLVSGGVTVNLFNNVIGDLRTPNANAANALIGLNITGGTTVNASFNTVRLAATSAGALFGSSAISASTTPTLTLRNNNFVNLSTANGTGLTVAYRRSSTTLSSYNAASNNNNFFAGAPSASNVVFNDGTNTDQTIAAYRSRVSTRDNASFSENANFASTTGSDANFLNINTSIATQLESGGIPVSGITTDFAAATRNTSTPDVGAFEFSGTPLDLVAPSITYNNLTNGIVESTRQFSGIAVVDPSGVNTATGTRPRIYYKKSTDTNDLSGWKFVEATNTSSPFTFTIDYSLLSSGSVVAGDVIQYFVVAQDNAAPTVGINSGQFAAQPSSVALTSAAFPITGTINSYNIVNSISGLITVCSSGCTYSSLTLAGGAFEAINNSAVVGDITIQINGNLSGENGTIALNEFAAPHTITIKPQNAGTTITGSSATGIVVLNAADRVIIDGSIGTTANTVCPLSQATRDLTISNTNTGTLSGVIVLQNAGTNGASNNIIRNLILVGQAKNTTRACIGMAQLSAGSGNNNNQFVNNDLRSAQNGIAITGFSATNKNTGNIIRLNKIDGTGTQAIGISGISASFEDNLLVDANTIANVLPTGSADGFGIALGAVSVSNILTSGNEVTNYTITNNSITNVSGASTFSSVGIFACTTSTAGIVNTIANNSIANTISDATSPDLGASIYLGGGSGTTRVYHNTISMAGTRTGGNQANYGIAVAGSNPIIDLRNNIIVNSVVVGTGTTLGVGSYAIGFAYNTYTNLTINNNNYFTSGTQAKFAKVGSLVTASGTDVANLSGLQSTIGQDANSLNVSPAFVSGTNLRLLDDSANLAISTGGANLNAFAPTDIDCATRPATPSLGFFNITISSCTAAIAGTATAAVPTICGSGSTTLSATGYSGGVGTTYQWQSSADAAFTTPVNLGTALPSYANASTGTITTTTYYRLVVTCSNGNIQSVSNVVTVTVNPIPTATASSNSPVCVGQ